jgi:hypothetical protein
VRIDTSAASRPDAGDDVADGSVVSVPRRCPRSTLFAWLAVGVAAVGAAALLLHVGRGLTWFYDEWSWILQRRTGSLDDFLANHNGHLNLVPVMVYKAMWAVFGLTDYTAFRVLDVVLHVATCGLLLVYLRRRTSPWFAVGAAIAVLYLGYAYQDLLWPFQIQYIGAVAAGLGAFLLLDRRDRAGDMGAALALGIAVACSGVGLPFAGAVAVELAVRRDSWRRLWVPLAPLALWGLWYLQYGQSQVKASNIDIAPGNAARMGAAAVGALAGTGSENGRYLIGALGAVVIIVLAAERRISPRFAAVLVLTLGYWLLTALSRAQFNEPDASRYLYPGAIFVVLVLSELIPRLRVPGGRVGTIACAVVVVGLLGFSVRGNVQQLRDGAAGLRDASTYVKAELRAVELARGRVDAAFRPDPIRAPQIDAGGYLAAVDDLGSPADSLSALRRAPAPIRTTVDAVLLRALDAQLTVASEPATDCAVASPRADGSVVVRGRSPSVVVEASMPVAVSARVLGPRGATTPIGTVPAASARALHLPATAAGPWEVLLASAGAIRVCPTG